jgi:hypothetical protein
MKSLKKLLSNALSRLYLTIIYGSDLHHRDGRVRYEAVRDVGDLSFAGKCNPHAFNLLVKVYENKGSHIEVVAWARRARIRAL